MTVAVTQGVANQHKKTRQQWQAQRRRDPDIQRARPAQTPLQFQRGLAQIATAFPGAVKIKGLPAGDA